MAPPDGKTFVQVILGSISADWVSAVTIGHEGILCVGANAAQDRYDVATGHFRHFRNRRVEFNNVFTRNQTGHFGLGLTAE